jgi:hypothetical protein
MKLLEAARMDIGQVTYGILYDVQSAIEDRLDWLDDREPESDGQVHDDWQDKRDDLEDIAEKMQKLDDEDEHDRNEIVDPEWKSVLDDIDSYHSWHKGLSRIVI